MSRSSPNYRLLERFRNVFAGTRYKHRDSSIDAIESLPPAFESRADFIRTFVAAGKPRTLAEWLAGSLEKENNHVRFGLDLNEVRVLILDYFKRDLWPVVEHPPRSTRVHLVIADRSDSYSAADRRRALQIAASSQRVTVDILPGGHWLHADNPDAVLAALVRRIDR